MGNLSIESAFLLAHDSVDNESKCCRHQNGILLSFTKRRERVCLFGSLTGWLHSIFVVVIYGEHVSKRLWNGKGNCFADTAAHFSFSLLWTAS